MMSRRTNSALSRSSSGLSWTRGNVESSRMGRVNTDSRLPNGAREAQAESPSRVDVSRVIGVLDGARADRSGDLLDAVTDAARRAEAPQLLDAIEGDAIRSRIGRGRVDAHTDSRDVRLELLFQVAELVVLEVVPHVQDRRSLWKRRGHREHERPRDVGHVYERAPLAPAEDRDASGADGLHREQIDDEVEAHARRESIDRSEAEDHRVERSGAVKLEETLLGVPSGLRVEGERFDG